MIESKQNSVYRPTILAVDDRQDNLLVLKTLLCGLDAEILTACSGREAIDVALTHSDIAIILLDVQMPEMDGFETAETLRRNKSTQTIPIIFVSAEVDDAQHIFRGYECGAVDFLPKPIPEHVLHSKLSVFLELSRKQASLQRAIHKIEESWAELERSNKALNEFAHMVPHDLKSPVRHISVWTEIIFRDNGQELSESTVGKLRRIGRSAKRLQDLISALLEYARLGGSSPTMGSVGLNGVLDNVRAEFADVIAETGAMVNIADSPDVIGNPLLLQQLFQNLLGNSLKYRKPNLAPRIQVTCERDVMQGSCRVSVSDNGIGFDPKLADLIFEPFRRLVTRSEFEGSGIGMSTARKIVELHGGTISATGVQGQGATFTVTLPMAIAHDPVLVIVDEDLTEFDTRYAELAESGFEILTARSAKEALGILLLESVDLVLTTYQMSGEHGFWLLERVQKLYPHIGRLLTSSVPPLALEENLLSQIVQVYYPKPVVAQQLREFMEKPTDANLFGERASGG